LHHVKKNKKSAVKQQKNMSTTTRQTGVKIITQISNFVDCTYTLYMYIKNQHMQIQLQTKNRHAPAITDKL